MTQAAALCILCSQIMLAAALIITRDATYAAAVAVFWVAAATWCVYRRDGA